MKPDPGQDHEELGYSLAHVPYQDLALGTQGQSGPIGAIRDPKDKIDYKTSVGALLEELIESFDLVLISTL